MLPATLIGVGGSQVNVIAVLGRARGDGVFHTQQDVGTLGDLNGEGGDCD